MIEMVVGFLILCAVIALAITVVRSMLNHWQAWGGIVVGGMALLLVVMVAQYVVMKVNQ
jgi:hypothetical protein